MIYLSNMIDDDCINVNIKKPMDGHNGLWVGIRSTIIDNAIQQKKLLRISVPKGTAIADPALWKQTGKIIKKRFKYDTPMILYCNYVPVGLEKKEDIQPRLWN